MGVLTPSFFSNLGPTAHYVFSSHSAQMRAFAHELEILAAAITNKRDVLANLTIEDDIWDPSDSFFLPPTTILAFSIRFCFNS